MDVQLENLPGPERLERYRTERYIGDENAVALEEFQEEDAKQLVDLYALLMKTLEELREAIDRNSVDEARKALQGLDWQSQIHTFARNFSSRDLPTEARKRMQPIYHDLRGGALTVAAGRAELLVMDPEESTLAEAVGVFNAVRDHLKIMRNLIRDIDPERRAQDLSTNHHTASLLREKWSGYQDSTVEIDFHSDYDGDISSCCLEFSSVDRAVYNVVNNAIAHTADGRVGLFVRGKGSRAPRRGDRSEEQPADVQIATINAVAPDEAKELEEHFGDDLGRLFLGGFTIGGTGVGLSVCAELVSNAYGLTDAQRAVEEGYVGAMHGQGQFVAWIHWPTLG